MAFLVNFWLFSHCGSPVCALFTFWTSKSLSTPQNYSSSKFERDRTFTCATSPSQWYPKMGYCTRVCPFFDLLATKKLLEEGPTSLNNIVFGGKRIFPHPLTFASRSDAWARASERGMDKHARVVVVHICVAQRRLGASGASAAWTWTYALYVHNVFD
jgi:hypothetical protein